MPVIVLDPGHGGPDSGAVGHGLMEKDLTLALALQVAEKLDRSALGKVILTRKEDRAVGVTERVSLANRAGADLFLSLHVNAGGGEGFESYIYRGLAPGSRSAYLRGIIHRETLRSLEGLRIRDRGEKRGDFYVLRRTHMPAVLLECLFIDNPREADLWRQPDFRRTLAAGIAGGLIKSLAPAVGEPRDKLYIVQVGAFKERRRAERFLDEVRRRGFDDAFIREVNPNMSGT